MNFGEALKELKAGKKLQRKGWNGKGMFVVYQKGYPKGIPANKNTSEAWGIKEGDLFICEPYLQMKNVQGHAVMWTATNADILAEDWQIVGE